MGKIAGNSIPNSGTHMHKGMEAGNGLMHSIPMSDWAKLVFREKVAYLQISVSYKKRYLIKEDSLVHYAKNQT